MDLIDAFYRLDVGDNTRQSVKCLPFNPGSDFASTQDGLRPCDRYLFRLFDKHSDGTMDADWVRSKDAHHVRQNSDKDVFARTDRESAATALRRHLQWEGRPDEEDNFVSWSNSLLFVLQYAFYRVRYFENLGFADMYLCIVDTALLPPQVFMRDMDLITAFSKYDTLPAPERQKVWRLSSLHSLRLKRHREYSGSYYFGEYLSQGALRIQNCCSIVSMKNIIDAGLFTLRPELGTGRGKWADSVIEFREVFYNTEPRYYVGDYELESALCIANAFAQPGPAWKLPIVLAFLALKPRHAWDKNMLTELRKLYREDQGALELSPERMTIMSLDTLPEVQHFDQLRRCVYEDSLSRALLHQLNNASNELHLAMQYANKVRGARNIAYRSDMNGLLHEAVDIVVQATAQVDDSISSLLAKAG